MRELDVSSIVGEYCSHLKGSHQTLAVGKGKVDSTLETGGCEQCLAVPLGSQSALGLSFPRTGGYTPEQVLKQLALVLISELSSRGAEDR